MSDLILLDGQSLSIEQVVAVARGLPGTPAVRLSEEARSKVARAADARCPLAGQRFPWSMALRPALALSKTVSSA